MAAVTFSLGDTLRLSLELGRPRFGLRAEDLFSLAVRDNPNRAFLFVSKVLGKHLPIRPAVLPAAGKLLALALEGAEDPGPYAGVLSGERELPFPALLERLERERTRLEPEASTLFIGFAETATGLARAVAACFTGECAYLSTTRYALEGCAPITFDESHSHAKTHLLHFPPDGPSPAEYRRAVIVDDEFTTGNTALKLVELLYRRFGIVKFTLLSLLDWSDPAGRRALAGRLGVEIKLVSLLHGSFLEVQSGPRPPMALEDWRNGDAPPCAPKALPGSGLCMGRVLCSPREQAAEWEFCRRVAADLGPAEADTLFLGTGELIYQPALIAGYCGAAWFHSTTQSPVCPLPGSAVETGVRFTPPDQYSSAGYLYNVPRGRYPRAVILSEGLTHRRRGLDQLASWLRTRGCQQVEVVLL